MRVQKTELEKRLEKEVQEREEKKLAQELREDFEKRREARRRVESGWLLNLNFLSGNQYCDVSPFGGVEEEDQRFFWQSRRVFNHISPTVEARIARLEKQKPTLCVRAFSDEEGDVQAAQLATGILKCVSERIGLDRLISKAINWSETCGSVFYKVLWNEKGGRQVAVDEQKAPIFEGEVQVSVVPAFEIFPDRLDVEEMDEVQSIIHAQAVTLEYVREKFGVSLKGERVESIKGYSEPSAGRQPVMGGKNVTVLPEGVLLLERYTRPNAEFPLGKLEIVAQDKVLYTGVLPYTNHGRGERGFPFVKQDSLCLPGTFFGHSIVDRLIPVQRAYNAVRNRKHEFLNRLSMGVLAVEDGSVDTDALAEEGLQPGKVLVYRQGGQAPALLDCGDIPSEFKNEEEWLEQEFALISGVRDLTLDSTPTRVTSASGLQLLLAQDESRLSASLQCIDRAVKEVGKQILQLYRQFAGSARLMTMTGENKKTQVYYFNASKLDVEDIRFERGEHSTPEEKRAVLLQLLDAGLLADEDGKVSKENKNRILQAFGFGGYENARDISALHIAKASEENLDLRSKQVEADEYDEHDLHITEHTRFLLSEEFKKSGDKQMKERFLEHLKMHEDLKRKKDKKEETV